MPPKLQASSSKHKVPKHLSPVSEKSMPHELGAEDANLRTQYYSDRASEESPQARDGTDAAQQMGSSPMFTPKKDTPTPSSSKHRETSPDRDDRGQDVAEYSDAMRGVADGRDVAPPDVRRRPSALASGGLRPRQYSDTPEYERPYYSAGRESTRPLRARASDYFYEGYDRDYPARDRRFARRDVRDWAAERDEREDFERWQQEARRTPSRPYQHISNSDTDMYDPFERRLPARPYYQDVRFSDQETPAKTTPKSTPKRQKVVDEEASIEGYDYEGQRNRSRSRSRKRRLDLASLSPEEKKQVMQLPWLQWMDSNAKNHFVATLGEFIGTTMFLFFAFAGTQVANIQSQASSNTSSTSNTTSGGSTGFNISVYLYISVIFGFSLMVNVWIFFRISGGLFNPAVTLGMALVGAVPVVRSICLFIAQIAGGIAASAMVRFLFPTEFNVRTTLAGGTSLVQGVFIEAFLTAELVFTIFMLAKEKHKATFIAPVGIGLALFISEMVGVYYTGGSLNPARSFGPCVVTGTFDREHWIYWVGPIIGTLIAVFFYGLIKVLEYEMANPGQDGDDENDPTKSDEKAAEVIRHEARYKGRFTGSLRHGMHGLGLRHAS